jgi:hypothetical protein
MPTSGGIVPMNRAERTARIRTIERVLRHLLLDHLRDAKDEIADQLIELAEGEEQMECIAAEWADHLNPRGGMIGDVADRWQAQQERRRRVFGDPDD